MSSVFYSTVSINGCHFALLNRYLLLIHFHLLLFCRPPNPGSGSDSSGNSGFVDPFPTRVPDSVQDNIGDWTDKSGDQAIDNW